MLFSVITMNTKQLMTIIKSDAMLRPLCRGVFPADCLPTQCMKPPWCLIANTDIKEEPGSHWVAIFVGVEQTEFFDSFGRSPEACASYFRPFLRRHASKSPLKVNDKQIQDFFSTACGQHCLYFLLHRVRGLSMSRIVNQFTKDWQLNDSLVNAFIERRYDVALPIVDDEYLAFQIARIIFKKECAW